MGGYVGITDDYAVYEESEVTEVITVDNIEEFFTVLNSTYYFAGSGGTFSSNNGGVNSTTAQTELVALYDMDIKFFYYYSSEANYDKFTLIVGDTTVENGVSGSYTSKWYEGSITAGDIITFKYVKDSSTHSNNDVCVFSDMSVTCTKKTLVDTVTESRARKILKGYVGISNKARAIVKGYVGVAGKARPCFTGGELAYFGTITPLSRARAGLGAATTKSYAVFRSGSTTQSSNQAVSTLDVYDSNLTLVHTSTDGGNNMGSTGVSFGDYAMFGGGEWDGDNSTSVTYYNDSLTRKSVTMKYGYGGIKIGGATAGSSYAIFIGSDTTGSGNNYGTAFNSSLTMYQVPPLLTQRLYIGSASIGEYAIFAGGTFGIYNTPENYVEAYDELLTLHTLPTLTNGRYDIAGCNIDNYALFGGGYSYGTSSCYADVDCYNDSLTKINVSALSVARKGLSAVGLKGYGIFAGGENGNTSYNTVDVYDRSLTKIEEGIIDQLSEARADLGGVAFGDYALFAGGYINNDTYAPSATIDVYTVK